MQTTITCAIHTTLVLHSTCFSILMWLMLCEIFICLPIYDTCLSVYVIQPNIGNKRVLLLLSAVGVSLQGKNWLPQFHLSLLVAILSRSPPKKSSFSSIHLFLEPPARSFYHAQAKTTVTFGMSYLEKYFFSNLPSDQITQDVRGKPLTWLVGHLKALIFLNTYKNVFLSTRDKNHIFFMTFKYERWVNERSPLLNCPEQQKPLFLLLSNVIKIYLSFD